MGRGCRPWCSNCDKYLTFKSLDPVDGPLAIFFDCVLDGAAGLNVDVQGLVVYDTELNAAAVGTKDGL